MLLINKTELTNYLALYDTVDVFVETVFYGDKSYINIRYSNGNAWYTLKYCAFENEENVSEISKDVIDILSDYYNENNLKTIIHFIR